MLTPQSWFPLVDYAQLITVTTAAGVPWVPDLHVIPLVSHREENGWVDLSCSCKGILKSKELNDFPFFFKLTFIWMTVSRMDIQLSCVLIHSLRACDACKSWGWTGLKPGARHSIWSSPMGNRNLGTWAIHCCLPGCVLAGSWIRSRVRTLKWGADVPSSTMTAVPNTCPLKWLFLFHTMTNWEWSSALQCFS